MENWKDVKGYEGLYAVSDKGRVKNLLNNRHLVGTDNGCGYRKVELRGKGKPKKAYIHRLVAVAFLGEAEPKVEVNHKDGNPGNNAADNLEWVSSSENTRHAVYRRSLKAWGNAAKPIQSIDIETGKTLEFATISEAERFFNTRHITHVLKGKRQSAKGQTFRYLEGGAPIVHFDYRRT